MANGILMSGQPMGALDANFVSQARQSPIGEPEDPYRALADALRMQEGQATSEIERIKGDKLGKFFNALGAFGAGIQGQDASRYSLQGRLDPWQEQQRRAQMGIAQTGLQRQQAEQEALKRFQQQATRQFGAQETFKDEKGNLFFGTTVRDPNTGQLQSVLAPVSGEQQPIGQVSIAGAYGLTAPEKIEQIAAEGGAKTRAEADERVRQDYIKQGTAAKGQMRNIDRLLELNSLIRTGKTAGARKAFGDFFGVTDPNLGEFDSRAGQYVLGTIRQLGANPTEGERAYLENIGPGIQQGQAVNEAILRNLKDINQRQIERARWLVQNPGKSIEEYLLLEEDFQPIESQMAAPTQEQPAPAQPSIDDLIKKYGG